MHVLLLDNFDSFTYNLFHLLEAVGFKNIEVKRNDLTDSADWEGYDLYVLSPGPGLPVEAGCLLKVIDYAVQNQKPILGICLGHQALGEYFGIPLINLPQVYHGRQHIGNIIKMDELFKGLDLNQKVARYHSWTLDTSLFNNTVFDILMEDEEQEVLAMKHKNMPIYSFQFHPESVLTENGFVMMSNFRAIVLNSLVNF